MCCRYRILPRRDDAVVAAILAGLEKKYPGLYKIGEIFPGDAAPAVIEHAGKLVPVPATFGFPGFDGKKTVLNARSETAEQKPTFAQSLRQRRIVLPADGFFEWSKEPEKTKYLFTADAGKTIYLCGCYKNVDGVLRFVILTRPANGSVQPVHDRMPVIAFEEEVRPFLTDTAAALNIVARASPFLVRARVEET